jgi:hypothetical protein
MDRNILLKILPEPEGNEDMIKKRQDVYDIINEVLAAHDEFAADYDLIADRFANGNVPKKLYQFCRENVTYEVEKEKWQTTRSPAVLLQMGFGDCKHFAGFIAGVLDALNRSGRGRYNWVYRFAYYDEDPDSPGHVFVCINNADGSETWIDPVLNEFDKRRPYPVSINDKKKHSMALVRMSGMNNVNTVRRESLDNRLRSVGGSCGCGCGGKCDNGPLRAYGYQVIGALDEYGSGAYYGKLVFDNNGQIPGAGNAFLANPPITYWIGNQELILPPPNQVIGGAVPALPMGLVVQYAPSFMGLPIPVNMPRPVVNTNNRLQISPLELGANGTQTNQLLMANHNFLLSILQTAIGTLVNAYSSHPYTNPAINGPGTSGAFNASAHYILALRNKDNFLDPQIEKTFAGEVISDIGNTVIPIIKPIASTVVNAVVPGAGVAVNALLSTEQGVINNAENQNTQSTVNTALSSGQLLPADQSAGSGLSIDLGSTVNQFVAANPLVAFGLLAAAGLLIYELTKGGK